MIFVYLIEPVSWGRGGKGGRRARGLHTERGAGLGVSLTILRSCLEPKSGVGHFTDRATQVPQFLF